jgi:autotransporter-associated beta strand protein
MKSTTLSLRLYLSILSLSISGCLWGQRPMEKLDRSVVALKTSSGVYVNWRIPSEEWYNVSYNLYRDGTKLNTLPITGASNYTDAAGTSSSVYTVTSLKNGVESAPSKVAKVLTTPYKEIKMRDLPDSLHYELNDATAADLDGDGEYEIIVKRLNTDFTNLTTDKFTYFEAYKLDGTLLWAIDVGPNIINDVEINIMAYDFDGDGKAEVVMRSSEGTIDGQGNKIGDTDGDGITNYRSTGIRIDNSPFMIKGPEFLSLYDGTTGKELDRVDFIGREPLSQWGPAGLNESQLSHRSNKFFFGAPFLDGKHPNIFTGRGIYYRTKFQTYDVVNKKIQARWSFDSGTGDYCGQGNHNYTIADVDDDGRDEIVWGSMCVDDDGTGLYSTKMGHGDAMHVGDFDPYHKGVEVFSCLEESPNYGTLFREAATGKILHHYVKGSDCGRCCAGNITDTYKGAELWGGGYGYSASDLLPLTHFGVAENFAVYWDGDLLQEICDHRGFTTTTGVGYGTITKFKSYGNIDTLLKADAYSCNWSKGTPCLQADILGDWREEEIWRSTDNKSLRIYVTPYETPNRIYTLMHDHQYRQAIAWQMCGYNQPPHVSYFLGESYTTPPPAISTNDKLVWTGTTSEWNTTSTNWTRNDTSIVYADGRQVLFDVSAINRTVEISGTLQPEVLTVSGPMNYTIGGTGSLTGTMRLNKLGAGSLILNGNHSYSGPTEVWDGNLTVNDTLSSSAVWLNRFATLGGTGNIKQGITMEYGSILNPDSIGTADTLIIGTSLTMKNGSSLQMDLSVNPSATATANQNDYLIVNGNLSLGSNLTLKINATGGSVSEGDYILAQISGSISGSLNNITITGILGKKFSLVLENGKLILRVTGVRDATSVVWSGGSDGIWDVSSTPNWLNQGNADIFVYKDSVSFTDNGSVKSVSLKGSLAPSYIKFNNTTSAAYTLSGTGNITGTGSLYKTNTGTVTLNTRNDYTGATIIDGGSLVMQYAPTITNNGGIGTNDTVPAKLVISNGASLSITTASETTNRGLTLGTGGGIISVPSQLTWNGRIIGISLIKQGAGTLILGANNNSLAQTILNEGTLKLGTESAIIYGPGKKVIINGGTLELLNNVSSYSTCSFAIDIPTGATGKIILDGRCDYNGALTGSGTLNLVTDYVRANLNGNWSAFTGTINVTGNTANSSYSNDFRINNTYGYANALINLGAGVITYQATSQTLKVGMLTGVATDTIKATPLEVGNKGTDGIFAGVIMGASSINKIGAGTWTLSGINTYTGSTTVSAGTLAVTGSKTGTGSVTIANGATLNVSGTVAGSITINSGGSLLMSGTISSTINNNGTLSGTGTISGVATLLDNSVTIPAGTSIGTLTFGSNVILKSNASLNMQISGTNSADKLSVAGNLTCAGTLTITVLTGTITNGSSYQLFSAGSITGPFNNISLPGLSTGLTWDVSELYTTGKINVVLATSVPIIGMKFGLLKNPSNGLFQVYCGAENGDIFVTITNMHGQIIYRGLATICNDKIDIDITDQPVGVYLLKLTTSKGRSELFRLLKQ